MILRSSVLTEFKTCPAKCFYKYELGLVPLSQGQRNDLAFGKLIHESIETFHETSSLDSAMDYIRDKDIRETKAKNKQTAKSLIKSYVIDNPVEMEEVEYEFSFPIGDYTWQGRLDGKGKYRGGKWVVEHKTTNPFYLNLKPNDQLISYLIGAEETFDENIDGILVTNLDCDTLKVTYYPVTFNEEEKLEWKEETRLIADVYETYKSRGMFPRNPSSCMAYNRLCPYHVLCSEPEGSRTNIMERCFETNKEVKNLEW